MNYKQSLLIAYISLILGCIITFSNLMNVWFYFGAVIILSSIPFYVHSVRHALVVPSRICSETLPEGGIKDEN